jgi:methylamine dehydrogenase accessory protein MauD
MTEALLVSNIILWVVIIALSLLVLALARQVGILHERVSPAGALQPTSGPKVGELTSSLDLRTLDGSQVVIGGENDSGLATFILFISPTCPVCKSLVPTAQSLIHSEKSRMQLMFASDGATTDKELAQHKSYVSDLNISDYPYIISQQLGMTYEVSKLPFAVLVGSDGILKSKGLVNTREHMESLIESMDSGIATLQEFVGRTSAEHVDTEADVVKKFEPSTVEQSS